MADHGFEQGVSLVHFACRQIHIRFDRCTTRHVAEQLGQKQGVLRGNTLAGRKKMQQAKRALGLHDLVIVCNPQSLEEARQKQVGESHRRNRHKRLRSDRFEHAARGPSLAAEICRLARLRLPGTGSALIAAVNVFSFGGGLPGVLAIAVRRAQSLAALVRGRVTATVVSDFSCTDLPVGDEADSSNDTLGVLLVSTTRRRLGVSGMARWTHRR